MDDMEKLINANIEQYKKTMDQALKEALDQQKKMAKEMGQEVTEEDRQELIDDYTRQAEQSIEMMRQQMQMQAAMMQNMAGMQGMPNLGDMMSQMMQAGDDDDEEDDDDEFDEEAFNAFIAENPVPDEYKKYMPIGALLIGTQGEPYETLHLIMDEDDTDAILSNGWGIDSRDEGLEMLESLLGGRHAKHFAKTFAKLKAGDTKGLDADDVEDYEASVSGITEILELPEELVENCTTLYAWDLERIGYLARLFVNIGYITEEEAWEWMAKAAVKIKENFKTWEEYIVSVLLGRGLAMGVHQEPYAVALDLLTENKSFLKANPIKNLA
ncbi:DUF1266 domain-containing protein [Breznakiella homolactica]|uniref:DUF1266 domain-containing protein n=1 Tax=Breznakiella homolactica TaxID=2798577 RepID=A0A7T7XM02_9SPIR|nr:DUF1266 domain-containing protein [Breznakiella homolactica]QQO08785.1 DUF1266 domain-containing protein [Breznakiella homolactica]